MQNLDHAYQALIAEGDPTKLEILNLGIEIGKADAEQSIQDLIECDLPTYRAEYEAMEAKIEDLEAQCDQINIPNLDALNPDELDTFANELSKLAQYAQWTVHAKRARLEGDIKGALEIERTTDKLYHTISKELQW